MSRGLDNNNPGNLVKSDSHYFVGEKFKSTDAKFRQFYEMAYGYRAMFRNLQFYRDYGWNTLRIIITHWDGETQEIVDNYVKAMLQYTGLPENEPLNMKDKATLIKLVAGISWFENGIDAVADDVEAGYNLLYDTKMQ
jgi:hypothetical protein